MASKTEFHHAFSQLHHRRPWNFGRLIGPELGDGVRLRTTIVQQKTGRPVPFERTETTRETPAAWLKLRGLRTGDWLFSEPQPTGQASMQALDDTPVRPARHEWVALIGLDPAGYSTHSLCRTKMALIYRRTSNLRACPLLGHTKLEPRRVSRRLQLLRGWSHDEAQHTLFA